MRNQRGFTAIEVAVVAGLIGIGSYVMSSMIMGSKVQSTTASRETRIFELRGEILAAISNQNAWLKTIARNPNTMRCLQDIDKPVSQRNVNYPCQNGHGGEFDLYDFTDQPIHKTSAPGYTANLEPCQAAAGTTCPIQVKLTWKAKCDATRYKSCLAADEFVDVVFTFDQKVIPLNADRFSAKNIQRRNLSFQSSSFRCAEDRMVFAGPKSPKAIVYNLNANEGSCVRPEGLIGPMGRMGPQGPNGPTGPQGIAGQMGPQGGVNWVESPVPLPPYEDGGGTAPGPAGPTPVVVGNPCGGLTAGALYMCRYPDVARYYNSDDAFSAGARQDVADILGVPLNTIGPNEYAAFHALRYGVNEQRTMDPALVGTLPSIQGMPGGGNIVMSYADLTAMYATGGWPPPVTGFVGNPGTMVVAPAP